MWDSMARGVSKTGGGRSNQLDPTACHPDALLVKPFLQDAAKMSKELPCECIVPDIDLVLYVLLFTVESPGSLAGVLTVSFEELRQKDFKALELEAFNLTSGTIVRGNKELVAYSCTSRALAVFCPRGHQSGRSKTRKLMPSFLRASICAVEVATDTVLETPSVTPVVMRVYRPSAASSASN